MKDSIAFHSFLLCLERKKVREMEGVLVKREGNGGRRGGGAIEGEEPKCIKRRRREPSMAVVGNKDDKREVQDPSSTTTSNATAPVKRSSRFRGVSRYSSFSCYHLLLL